jgi:hypothetical protein
MGFYNMNPYVDAEGVMQAGDALIFKSLADTKGLVDHTSYDHASVLKFIEANWKLPTVSSRSRDNVPNPVESRNSPYRPVNAPAIGDLVNLFEFPEHHGRR